MVRNTLLNKAYPLPLPKGKGGGKGVEVRSWNNNILNRNVMMKKEYKMPEVIVREVRIESIMDISTGLINDPNPDDDWDEMETREDGFSDDLWED